MKICIISFDIWGFDHFIKKHLEKNNIEAHHIYLAEYKYTYKSFFEKFKNFLSKTFLKKNIKKINREKFILKEIERLGKFDQILVINPELISLKTHGKIKEKTNRYISFLYDSLDRQEVSSKILNLFETVFSFDKKDCLKHNFIFITNYIYKDKNNLRHNFKYKAFSIISEDNRVNTLVKIADFFKDFELKSKFIVFSKEEKSYANDNIYLSTERISINEMHKMLEESEIFIDLIRDNQTGLSFRVFEALSMQRKLITTNETITDFDFYNENNILIIDKTNPVIPASFLSGQYEEIPENIYKKYTLENWIGTVFNLKNYC